MHGLARPLTVALVASLIAGPAVAQTPPAARTDTAALQRLLVAEDARGTGRDGLEPLLAALSSPDTLLRRLAVRGLGRFQRPELGRAAGGRRSPIRSPAVRAEAANAVAQSVRRIKRSETPSDGSQFGTLRRRSRALRARSPRSGTPASRTRSAQSLGRLPAPRQRGRARRRGCDPPPARAPADARRGPRALHPRPGEAVHRDAHARRASSCSAARPSTSRDTVVRRLALARPSRPPAGSTAPRRCAPPATATTRPGA